MQVPYDRLRVLRDCTAVAGRVWRFEGGWKVGDRSALAHHLANRPVLSRK